MGAQLSSSDRQKEDGRVEFVGPGHFLDTAICSMLRRGDDPDHLKSRIKKGCRPMAAFADRSVLPFTGPKIVSGRKGDMAKLQQRNPFQKVDNEVIAGRLISHRLNI